MQFSTVRVLQVIEYCYAVFTLYVINIFRCGIVTDSVSVCAKRLNIFHRLLFSTQIFMCAVGLRVMSIDAPCHAIVNVLEGQGQVRTGCNYSHLHSRIYFIQDCTVEIQLDTVWPQQERPAACVIAQQYSSSNLNSLSFHSGKEKTRRAFNDYLYF